MKEDKPIRIYQCEDSVDGILSGIYDAGISGYGHEFIRIQPQLEGMSESMVLFAEYLQVKTEADKVNRVLEAIRQKISLEAYQCVIRVVQSNFSDRGDAAYQFVTYGFTMGAKVTKAIQIPWVARVFEINRNVSREAYRFLEILRFSQVQQEPALLLGVIEPKHHILSMIMYHFADRLNSEYFIIYDKTHGEAVFHQPDGRMEIRVLIREEGDTLENLYQIEDEYPDLWRVFFDSVAVEARKNKKRQQGVCPIYVRKHMVEFHSKS